MLEDKARAAKEKSVMKPTDKMKSLGTWCIFAEAIETYLAH
jgi:hypothetical protein